MNADFSKWWGFLCLATLMVSGCGNDLTSKKATPLGPESIAGRQMEYADPHGVNIYTFFAGGRYRYATLSQNRSFADSREGTYVYTRNGHNTGTISFDNEPSIRLGYTGPNTATGRVDGDERVYQFIVK
ncbi:MAG: hypothetical protein ACKOLA_08535 [Spartobacteria bacterium]